MFPINIDWWIFHIRGYEGHWSVGTLALGYYLQRKRSLAAGFSLEWFQSAWIVSILSGMVFSRLFHFIFWDTENFLANPIIILNSFGGFAILGGTVGTAVGAWFYCKLTKVNFLEWCDTLMLPLTFCLAISRISCFLNGDGYGIPTSSVFGVVFSENSDTWMAKWNQLHQLYAYSENPLAVISQMFREYVNLSEIPLPPSLHHLQKEGIENIAQLNRFYPPVAGTNYKATLEKIGLFPFPVIYPKVHPTQLYEMVVLLFATMYLRIIEKKDWAKKNLFFIFWILYAMSRFSIEFLRGDKNFAFSTFTYAQVICLLIIIASTLLALLLNRKFIFKSSI